MSITISPIIQGCVQKVFFKIHLDIALVYDKL